LVPKRKELTKSITEQYIHWKQEIKLPDDIRDSRIRSELLKEKTAMRYLIFGTIPKKRKELLRN
jgi:hypothetical protein